MARKTAGALRSWVRGGWLLLTLVIGRDAVCSGGYRGEVLAVVIDPAARTMTDIVVEPKGRLGLARLVPLDLVDASPAEVRLRCTEAEFKSLDAAEETLAEFVPGYPDPLQMLPAGWRGAGGPTVEGGTIPRIPEQETVDIIPPGEVEGHRGDHVHASDGDIGRVHGFVIDPASRQVTHVVVKQGPMWARNHVAVPFDKVTGFDDGIRLSITRQQVRRLPSADIDHPAG
jgi:sporulation protein YlmC with PRC-barrel domain